MELLTAAQMRAIETQAIASGQVTGLELMERAGAGVVEAIFAEWPELGQVDDAGHAYLEREEGGRKRPGAVVLCGPGNNGGDGFVVARLLRARGWMVEVFHLGDPEKLPPDAKTNFERWCELGPVRPLDNAAFAGHVEDHPDTVLYVDALFGTGLSRPLVGLGHVRRELNKAQARPDRHVICIDVPSGLCSDSGRFLGEAEGAPLSGVLMADLTVTFHRPKTGLLLADGALASGRIALVDIGLAAPRDGMTVTELVGSPDWHGLCKSGGAHKYGHGHALVVSGGPGKTGAARLAARGALRIGAGLVTLACPVRALPEAAAQVTAIMLAGLDGPFGLAEILEDERLNAICLGPGVGLGQVTAEMVKVATGTRRPCVLDGDALTRFQRTPEALFAMLHARCVLTPHGGEFARLFPDIAEKLKAPAMTGPAYSKVDATREAAARAGCVVLFKGPDTVIADPEGATSVNSAAFDRAAPWLATAGAGDVLAGFITGLLARGLGPMQAAETAAWLHVECARSFGPGLIAEDLPEELPKVLAALRQTD